MRTPLFYAIKSAIRQNKVDAFSKNSALAQWSAKIALNRRNFLKISALAAIPSYQTACQGTSSKSIKVAIVGAGFAGLNAAYTLQNMGISATIFEASKRVGGRVFSVKDALGKGITTELGAEFIDSNHSEVWNLIKAFHLQTIDLEKDVTVKKNTYFIDNQHRSDEEIIKAMQPYIKKFEQHARQIKDNPDARRQMDFVSVKEYIERIWKPEPWLAKLMDVAYTTEYGLDCSEQSSLNLLELFTGDFSKGKFDPYGESDERYKIVGGNQQIATLLAENIQQPIEFETTLESLKREQSRKYILNFRQGNKTIEVKADTVIMAVPATILKTIDLDASLNFSAPKLEAIKKYQVGRNGKFCLGFDSAPWRANNLAGFLNTDNPYLQMGWDSSQMQGTDAAAYSVFYGGAAGSLFGDSQHKETYKSEILRLGEQSFKGFMAAHNNKTTQFHWTNHPFSKGAYSCHGLGHYHDVVPHIGTTEGRVFFAGEHCSYEYQGFMNGALLTGRLAAEGVLGSKK